MKDGDAEVGVSEAVDYTTRSPTTMTTPRDPTGWGRMEYLSLVTTANLFII